MLRFFMRASSGRGAVAILAAVAYLFQFVVPRHVLAWDEKTHDLIADWAFQVMKLAEFEGDPNNAQISYLTNAGLSLPRVTAAPAGCTGACLTTWNDLIAHVRAARAKYAEIPLGPASANADDESSADLVCAQAVSGDIDSGTRLRDLDPATQALDGITPKSGETNNQHCAFHDYEEGGIYDSPELTAMPGRLVGTTLGFSAQAADARLNDWDVRVNVLGAIISIAGLIVSFGTDANALDVVNKGLEAVRTGAAAVLVLFIALILLIGSGFQDDVGDVLDEAWHTAEILTHLDVELLSLLAMPFQGLATDDTDYVGLGHFVNVQEPRTLLLGGKVPSNEFDDQQGVFYDESTFDLGTDSQGFPILYQDDFDHYLQDVQSTLSPFVDPDSDAVSDYQLLGAVSDGSPPSKARGSINGSPDDDYWYAHELHEVAFTPLDNLAFHGFEQFQADSCKRVEGLHRPLHALGDAGCPLHTIGTTGQGHVPFEQSVDHVVGQWEAIRFFAPDEFKRINDDSTESTPPGMTRAQAFQKQHEQAQRILVGAANYATIIRTFQQNQPGRIPIRQLVTEEARTTLNLLRTQVPKLSCDRNACRMEQECPPGQPPGPHAMCEFVVNCTGHCSGFVTDPAVRNANDVLQTADPTDDPQPCSILSGGAHHKCTAEAYVAMALSSKELAGVPYPATLAPSLSQMYDDGEKGLTRKYFDDYRAEQRLLLENAVSATLAFLAYTADTIPASIPDSCMCDVPGTTYCAGDQCRDLSIDKLACGHCGNRCADSEACIAGTCVACTFPFQLCGTDCVNTNFNPQHCGSCTNVCPPAQSWCTDGACIFRGPD